MAERWLIRVMGPRFVAGATCDSLGQLRRVAPILVSMAADGNWRGRQLIADGRAKGWTVDVYNITSRD